MDVRLRIDGPELLAAHKVKCLLEGMARGSIPYFSSGSLPGLYESGIVFRPSPSHGRIERFCYPPQVLEQGWGDCDMLVVYRCAELMAMGIDATVTNASWHSGEQHVQVRLPDGTIEDPSILLGAKSDWPNWFLYDAKKGY